MVPKGNCEPANAGVEKELIFPGRNIFLKHPKFFNKEKRLQLP